MAQAIFKSWFVDFEPFDGVMPSDWREEELGNVTILSAGGDKPTPCSNTPTEKCTVEVFSNGTNNFGLYGYTDIPKITEECVTISARGTIGYVCLRQKPFVPIVRLVTVIPNKTYISAKYLYSALCCMHITGVGTTQQQLTIPDFKKRKILIPTLVIVDKFTEIVNPMYDIIEHIYEENRHLASLRDTLLPRLMSGEIDVSKIEDYAAKL